MEARVCVCTYRESAHKYYNDPYNYSRRYFRSPREYAYTLQFDDGTTFVVGAAVLKNEIANGSVAVRNLKLTSDSKLILIKPAYKENSSNDDKSTSHKPRISSGITITRRVIKNIDGNRVLRFSHRDTKQLAAKAAMLGTKSVVRKVYGVTVIETLDSVVICSTGKIRLPEDCRELFDGSSFSAIDFTNVDWHNVKYIDKMFYSSMAKSIIFGDVHEAQLLSMKSAFDGSRAKTLDLTMFNTSGVEDMSWLFCNCKARKIVMDGIDTSNVKSMQHMFSSCNAYVSIKGIDTSNVKDMGNMFSQCIGIGIDYSQLNTSSVTTMKGMFNGFRHNILDIGSFDTGKVETMEGMFFSARIPSVNFGKMDTRNVKNMAFMFTDFDTGILDLSGLNTRSLKDIEGMFRGLKAYSIILGRYFNTKHVEEFINVFRDCTVRKMCMTRIDTSSGKNFLNMFRNSKFEELDLSSFRTENTESFECMFQCCEARTINLSSFRTPALKSMVNMFAGCKCEVIDLSTFSADSLENISYAFDSSKATKIIFGKQFITRKLQYAIDCFRASKADVIDLRSFDASSLVSATGMCRDCNAKAIYFGNFNPAEYKMCYYMFGSNFEGKIKTTSENILKSYENRKIGYPTI